MVKNVIQAALLCTVAMALCGCYAKREVILPDTFPVSGKVIAANGQIPAGYQIQFTPDDPEKAAFSPIESDGSFKLSTRYMGVECEGAAPGVYRVSMIPPLALCNQGVQPATLPQPIEIKAETTDLKIPFPGK